MQRDLVTTSSDLSSGPTADSESGLESKPSRKAGVSTNVGKSKRNAKHSAKAEVEKSMPVLASA
jgi:hypothetical protein